jgi:hypothetical protein
MNPDEIKLTSLDKLFEYEKISRDIDSIGDIELAKLFAKLYVRLYLKQQEILFKL